MDMDQAGQAQMPGAPMSRNTAFGQGQTGTPGEVASSLGADSARQNAMVPQGFTPQSVLHSYIQSPNGMSSADADRRLIGGGMLKSPNGTSMSSYEASRPIVNHVLNA